MRAAGFAKRFGFLAALASLFAASGAHAQEAGFAVNRFEPAERGSEWFALESLDLRGEMRPSLGVVGDWAYRPLIITDRQGHVVQSVVRDQVLVHPGASVVLWDRLRFAFDVPVQAFADGSDGVAGGIAYAAPRSSATIGDVRLGLDARLFGRYGDPATFALGFQMWIPTGDPASYTGDGNARVGPRALVAGDIGLFVYSARIGATVRGLDESFAGSRVGSDVNFGAAAGVRVANKKLVVGPEIFGSSVILKDSLFTRKASPLEGLFGAHYTIGDAVRVGAGVSTGLTAAFGTPVVRAIASLEWVAPFAPPEPPPPEDRDGDGVRDRDDACPDVPGLRSLDPRLDGCPLPPADRDGDGVPDAEDACPETAGVKTTDPKTNGCPSDRDHDEISDDADACPDVPGVRTGNPRSNGCPSDRDNDGIPDTEDACPDVKGLRTGEAKTNGCPLDPDRDKDGIANDQDACPDEPGKADPDPKRNGCPKAFVQAGQIKILDQVKFKTNSAEILPGKDSQEVLSAVLDVVKAHPEIRGIRVEGHTDNRGGDALNRKLSAARAASVVKWLVAHGVENERLTSEGFGADKPIDTNETEAGRTNNRRVEFHIEEPQK